MEEKKLPFRSCSEQDEVRDLIMQIFLQVAPIVKSVHDLGCGSGTLLRKLSKALSTDVTLVGVDVDRERLHFARQICPEAFFIQRNLCHYGVVQARPSIALISAIRFSDSSDGLEKALSQFDYLLIYSYDSDKHHEPTGWKKIVEIDKGHIQAALFKRE